MATKISKIFETCKLFWPASEDFVNSATVFVNSATPRGRAPAAPFIHFLSVPPERKPNQKKELENVLSSEAVTQILQITQCARLCRFACEELAPLNPAL
jgi:hypothetical protein